MLYGVWGYIGVVLGEWKIKSKLLFGAVLGFRVYVPEKLRKQVPIYRHASAFTPPPGSMTLKVQGPK